MVKRTPAYKNKLKALELERTGALSSKKKGGYKLDKYETITFIFFIIFYFLGKLQKSPYLLAS